VSSNHTYIQLDNWKTRERFSLDEHKAGEGQHVQEFMELRSDIERTDCAMKIPFVRDFHIKNKVCYQLIL
jgi:hypothetical protein